MQFNQILGQQKIKQNLIFGKKQGRIPHALMLSGTDGNGGLPLALAYATYLNCLSPGEEDSCGTCSSCLKFDKMVHPDLHLVFPTFNKGSQPAGTSDFLPEFRSLVLENTYANTEDWRQMIGSENKQLNINSKQCKDMIKSMAYKAFESEYKVMIVWLPEYLKEQGNILLKLIEEPAPKTVFILCTSQVDKILPTILSRTQIMSLEIPSYDSIKQFLVQQKDIEADTAGSIAILADGSLNRGLKLTRQIEDSQFHPMREWMQHCFKGNAAELNKIVGNLASKGREDLKAFLGYGLHILRACILYPYGVNNDKLTEEENTFISKLSQFFAHQKGERAYDVFNKAIYWIERNGNVKIVLFDLSLELQKIFKSSK